MAHAAVCAPTQVAAIEKDELVEQLKACEGGLLDEKQLKDLAKRMLVEKS